MDLEHIENESRQPAEYREPDACRVLAEGGLSGSFVLRTAPWECLDLSESFAELTGIDRFAMQAILEEPEEYLTGDEGRLRSLLEGLAAAPSVDRMDYEVSVFHGEHRFLRLLLRSVAEEGRLTVYGHAFDISDLIEREEELHLRESESVMALAQSGQVIFRYLVAGRCGIMTEEASAQLGLPELIDELPEWGVACWVDRGSVAEWRAFFAAIERGKESGEAEISAALQGRPSRRLRLRFTAVFDRRGEVVSAVVSVEDVSEMYERTRVRSIEFEGLLKAMQQVFPEMISLNVTRGTYRMLQYDQATTVGSPVEGQLSRLVELRLPYVLAEDQQMFSETFHVAEMRERLKNNDVIRLAYRRAAPGGEWVWMETTVMRHSNPFDEDVLAVAVSQNIDEQKAEEDRLREELHLRAEEIRLSAEKMGHVLCTYDVATRTLTIPADQAARLGMGQVLEQFPDTLDQAGNLPAEAVATLKTFYESIHSGAPRGRCEIIVLDQRGQERWERLEFATVFDREGVPRRTVISVDDVTDLRVQSVENRRLKENEQLLRIFAEHSSRTLCLYRTKTGLAHRWDEARCANCKVPKLCRMTWPELLQSGEIMPESVEAMREMFQEIHRGRSEGTLRACMKDDEGRRRWYDIRYSTLYDDIRQPMGAIISHEDVTDRHEQELAWLRLRQRQEQQSARFTIHCDLTADRVDSVSGAPDTVPLPFAGDSYSESLTRLLTVALPADQIDSAGSFFARERLLAAHAEGSRRLTGDFRVLHEDGSHGWVEALVELVADPYVGHIRALISISDNTGAKEQQLAVEARAEKDGMTGLLNRATCEERIRAHMADRTGRRGVLILFDLDDLKQINDLYGHEQGDRAIRAIAEMLGGSFRSGDFIGRAGGDEFLVYLPGAAGREGSIAGIVSSLLRKLALISVGPDDERRIHCSAGCASEQEGDSFDDLFQRADLALYHVKRSGKNGHAFFSPEMRLADYRFRADQAVRLQDEAKENAQVSRLLDALTRFYPLVVSCNLTHDSYRLLKATSEFSEHLPHSGAVDELVTVAAGSLLPEDRKAMMERLSRESLLEAYAAGRTSISHRFRYLAEGGTYLWAEVTVMFYVSESGDVCGFVMLRKTGECAAE